MCLPGAPLRGVLTVRPGQCSSVLVRHNQMFRLELRLAADRLLLRSDRNKGSVENMQDTDQQKTACRSCSLERSLQLSFGL